MNKLIKRIAKKADISMSMTEFTGCLEGQDYLVTDSNLSEMQLEKFAEEMVRKCNLHLRKTDPEWTSAKEDRLFKLFGVK